MKKILTLAIALVMVFAIAAPAFASGWDVEIPEIELKDLTLKIQALATEKSSNTTWNGGSGYAVLEKTYPVIAGTKVHAVVTVTVPASANLSKAMKAYMTNGQAQVKIETSNLENVKVKAVYTSNDKAYFNETLTGTKITKALASSDILEKGATITFEITANAEKSDKDAKIVAKLGVYNEWASDGTFVFEKNDKEYKVWNDRSNYFDVRNTKTGNGFEFQVDKDGASKDAKLVNSGVVKYDGNDYKVTKGFNNTLEFVGTDGNNITSGTLYNALKAVMDEIYGVLGFDYDGAKYMTRGHYVEFFGTVMEGTDGLTYPTGYVAELVTDDPSAKPPQTGDNASVVGFVMIAIALVAAAAVTVKKVRA